MEITEGAWCDFVVHTSKAIAIDRIMFERFFWENELLPKLVDFFDNCLPPEIVSPIHALGMQVHDFRASQ